MNSFMLIIAFTVFTLFVEIQGGNYFGLDLSVHQGNVSQNSWNCLKSSQFKDFAIIHAWRSLGAINPYVNDMIKKARAAGYTNVDVYAYLKFGMSPTEQIEKCINFIKSGGQKFGRLWIDIEGQNWGKIPENVKFVKEAVAAAEKLGVKVGIYCGWNSYARILGTSTDFKHLPLWYPHYDDKPSFEDWREYGGWKAPVMKQYKGTTSICGTSIDKNWRPEL